MKGTTRWLAFIFSLWLFGGLGMDSVNAAAVPAGDKTYRIQEVTYTLDNASQDAVYKQLTYHISLEDHSKAEVTRINPVFEKNFDESVFHFDTDFHVTKKQDSPASMMVDVYIAFDSRRFDVKKLNHMMVIDGLTIERNNKKTFFKIDQQVPVIKTR